MESGHRCKILQKHIGYCCMSYNPSKPNLKITHAIDFLLCKEIEISKSDINYFFKLLFMKRS